MKLTQNKIDEIIVDILGTDGLRLVKALKNKENVSEFSLATRLRRDIKIIRHMLYKLHNQNLVCSTRKKDKQKGWYVYYWTIIPENIKFLYIKNKRKLLNKLKAKLEKEETDQFFVCVKRCVRLDFDQAMDFEFHCPECGEIINQDQDNKRIIQIQKKVSLLEKELADEEKEAKLAAAKLSKMVELAVNEKPAKKTIKKKVVKIKPKGKKPVKRKIHKKKIKKKTKK